ncbi:MAG: AI-2E family transporter [Propionibacteriaceae bacterium]|nr:AI-2E family transporter [Propionibacteriaceae bacterium]
MPSTAHPGTPIIPLPRPLRVVAAGALLVVLIYAAGWVLIQVGGMVSEILIPIIVGVLLAALLMPLQVLMNHTLRLPRHVAGGAAVLGLIGVVSGTIWFAGQAIAGGIDELGGTVQTVLTKAEDWLATGPLGIDSSQLGDLFSEAQDWLTRHTSSLTSGVLTATTSASTVLVGLLLALIVAFFLLAEGDRILSFLLMVIDEPERTKARETLRRAWVTLGSWARTQVVVSAVDAIGIGLGAWALQLPFIIPLSIITFLLCFIPLFGAVLAGFLFVLVALLFKGTVTALIMLVIVVVVMQLEGNVMQPLLMGKAVNLHPLVVLLGVTTGTYLLGLTGALLTVPVLASVNAGYKYWVGRDPFPGLAAGGSALTGSPRRLAPQGKGLKLPRFVGSATPQWIEQDRVVAENTPSKEEENSKEEQLPQ